MSWGRKKKSTPENDELGKLAEGIRKALKEGTTPATAQEQPKPKPQPRRIYDGYSPLSTRGRMQLRQEKLAAEKKARYDRARARENRGEV